MVSVYLFSADAECQDRQLLGTHVRKGQERITWIQENPNNVLTRRWFAPDSEPAFEPSSYASLHRLD